MTGLTFEADLLISIGGRYTRVALNAGPAKCFDMYSQSVMTDLVDRNWPLQLAQIIIGVLDIGHENSFQLPSQVWSR